MKEDSQCLTALGYLKNIVLTNRKNQAGPVTHYSNNSFLHAVMTLVGKLHSCRIDAWSTHPQSNLHKLSSNPEGRLPKGASQANLIVSQRPHDWCWALQSHYTEVGQLTFDVQILNIFILFGKVLIFSRNRSISVVYKCG